MTKRSIIYTTAIVLLIATALICFVPRFTQFDEVMSAVKLDADGNVLDIVTFRVQASKKDYLFLESKLSYWIPDFDTLKNFDSERNAVLSTSDYCFAATGAVNIHSSEIVFCDLYSSPELDRWLLWNRSDAVFYVASPDPNDSASELLSYFAEVIGDDRIPTTLNYTSQQE